MARLPTNNEACHGILRLSFADVETPSERFPESELFSHEQATQIWDFVDQHRPQVERVVIHCDAGVSRSSAVAAAIARMLNGDDSEFFGGRYRPNQRVYRTLLESYARGLRSNAAVSASPPPHASRG